jgi:hypothetical protein
MKNLLTATSIGVALTILLFVSAGALGGACHCTTPTILAFPYAAITLERFGAETIALLVMAIQFPLYAIFLAKVTGNEWRVGVFLILLIFHATAAAVSLVLSNQ